MAGNIRGCSEPQSLRLLTLFFAGQLIVRVGLLISTSFLGQVRFTTPLDSRRNILGRYKQVAMKYIILVNTEEIAAVRHDVRHDGSCT